MTDLRRRLGERGRAHDGDAAVADSRARDLRTDRGDEAVVRGARLLETDDDPRRGRKPAPTRKGRNTESFDPASTLGRPDLRVRVGAPHGRYAHPLRHDDLIIVPGFFGDESDWSTYHALIRETRAAHAELAARGQRGEQCDWMAWHEGCHLISRAVSDCPTFQKVLRRMADYFGVEPSAKVCGARAESQHGRAEWNREGMGRVRVRREASNAGRKWRAHVPRGFEQPSARSTPHGA